ncbi:MAG: hypothetical protein AAF533_16620 [Acidobacteriota bacterium]
MTTALDSPAVTETLDALATSLLAPGTPALGALEVRVLHQLGLALDREQALGDEVGRQLGATTCEAVETARLAHPLIGLDAGFTRRSTTRRQRELKALIFSCHRREAATLEALTREAPEQAFPLAALVGHDLGRRTGIALREHAGDGGPQGVHEALAVLCLEGLPGQRSITLLEDGPRAACWVGSPSLREEAERQVGLDPTRARRIHSSWCAGLVKGLDPRVDYRESECADGSGRRHELRLLTG